MLDTALSPLQVLNYLILTTVLEGWVYYSYFYLSIYLSMYLSMWENFLEHQKFNSSDLQVAELLVILSSFFFSIFLKFLTINIDCFYAWT